MTTTLTRKLEGGLRGSIESLHLGYFPKIWKHSHIIQIPKPGKNKSDPRNYRPISLLNVLGKVAEKIIQKRLKSEIGNNDLIRNEQFGFRSGHSCTQQLLRTTEFITTAFNLNRTVAAIFLDYTQAFDRVWHAGLIHKLINNNLNCRLVKLLDNYIRGRTFQVKLNDVHSRREIKSKMEGYHRVSVVYIKSQGRVLNTVTGEHFRTFTSNWKSPREKLLFPESFIEEY
ncbi:hypothetical protein ANN_08035 [Periplaneta americana]|uniref:Reverse transcriptase domain-containing protein n=1 Tax=Periplaneta americana TaxID=6978 RepID=A0ABQ8T1P2_PERAM|nr:hypothetical protein ANN_08035 [Periplaneta americana]